MRARPAGAHAQLSKACAARRRLQRGRLDRRARRAQGVVKRFFNEKEVTSTLVMDALFSGCKQLEEASRLAADSKKARAGPGSGPAR